MRSFCAVCGGTEFTSNPVLWDGLANEWQLSQDERHYIDRQQGERCRNCEAQLRCIALAEAIMMTLPGNHEILRQAVSSRDCADIRILEINEAGTLHSWLSRMVGHVFAEYPNVDMHALPYDREEFDLVVHADTLEHINNPVHALTECLRVLRPGGKLIYTVPIVVGRLTRSRAGLPPSYHGDPAHSAHDYLVYTEYGADAWVDVLRAGFRNASINAVEFPSALAITATR